MACIVESYNPALAPSGASITIPESLRAKFGVAASETLFMSPRAIHSLSQDLCSSEHSLRSSSGSAVAAVGTSPAPPVVSTATRAEPSSPSSNAEQLNQLGRPSAVLATHIHRSMRQREAALPSLQLASPQLHKRCALLAAVILAATIYVPLAVLFPCRGCIVDFLHSACETLHLTRNTRFLAMHLIDHFMDKHIVMDYRLKLVALTCLLVAGELSSTNFL